jgi:hypothetical protein
MCGGPSRPVTGIVLPSHFLRNALEFIGFSPKNRTFILQSRDRPFCLKSRHVRYRVTQLRGGRAIT